MDEKNTPNLDELNQSVVDTAPVDEAPAEVSEGKKDWKSLKLNYPQTLKVGLGFAVVMIFWQVYNFVVPLLLDNAFGFSNTIRNLIVGIASAMCMVLLPVFGKLSDRCKSKYGRRTPFIVVGTVITIIAMLLVPLSVNKQLQDSTVIKENYAYAFMTEDPNTTIVLEDGSTIVRSDLLGEWFDLAAGGDYSKITKSSYNDLLKEHDGDVAAARADFCSLYNKTVSNDGLFSVIGVANRFKNVVEQDSVNKNIYRVYTAVKGKEGDQKVVKGVYEEYDTATKSMVEGTRRDMTAEELEAKGLILTEEQYETEGASARRYSKYLADSVNDFCSERVQKGTNWGGWFAFFLIALVLIIFAQTVIRTPAVSLMPDVTPSPLRSPGNAMINLVGGIGGGIGFLIYTVTFLIPGLATNITYWIIFGVLAATLAIVLTLFILLVKEKKWVEGCRTICKEYGLPTDLDNAEENTEAGAAPQKKNMFAKYGKKKMTSFILILASIFMWFVGYNSIANNMPIYCLKILNVSAGIASIVSGASMVVAAIGFIPVGIVARKFGRRLSIMFGFLLAVVSYILVASCVVRGEDSATIIFIVCYMVSGFGLIFANVNTLPMVLELSDPKDIGTFTGIYYIATMSAQTVGPIFGGLVMDNLGGQPGLFIFAAVCVAVGIGTMAFVKHGEAPDFVAMQDSKKQAKLEAQSTEE